MTLGEKQEIFLQNFARLILWGFEQGYHLRPGELLRTKDQQMLYFEGFNIVKYNMDLKLIPCKRKSKTMYSRHLEKLAGDLNRIVDGVLSNNPKDYQPLGEYWISLHSDNVWGSDWNKNHSFLDETFQDPYHFEMKP
jgi:hypothetical protein